jgi:soluble lytic murein transglycosylase-like protein
MSKVLLILCASLCTSGCGVTAQEVRDALPGGSATQGKGRGWTGGAVQRCEAVVPLLEEASEANNIDHGLLVGIVKVESTFRPDAVSRVGALGLMQVMPRNAHKLACGDLREPEANIACGVRVLKGFLRYYKDDIVYALSGYNAGFAQPNLARRQGRLPKNRAYVEKVLAARASYLRYGCGS